MCGEREIEIECVQNDRNLFMSRERNVFMREKCVYEIESVER